MSYTDRETQIEEGPGGVSFGVILVTIIGIGFVGVLFIHFWFRFALAPPV
jgi:hypothetical protein